jgi:DNA-binding CsgD family transcriptional regulator
MQRNSIRNISPEHKNRVNSIMTDAIARGVNPSKPLTEREHDILQGTLQGMSTKEIAYSLSLSNASVLSYRGRIMEKYNANSVQALIAMLIGTRDQITGTAGFSEDE